MFKTLVHEGEIATAWNKGYDSRSIINPYDAETEGDCWLAWNEGYQYRAEELNASV